MKNLNWITVALALTIGVGTLASAQQTQISPVTQTQVAKADLPEANDVTDTTVDTPEAGDVADQGSTGVTDTPEAGDVADQASTGVTDTPEAGDTVDSAVVSGK